jgi:chitinase
MRLNRLLIVLAIGFACARAIPVSETPASQAPAIPQPLRVVGYFASWDVKSKGTRIADLPAKDLTHIYYAFAKIGNDGRVILSDPCVDVGTCVSPATADSGGNFAALARLKALNPHLKLAISIGGWTDSGKFSDAAVNELSRRLFARSAIDLFIRQRPGLFDGIDIDWEFPVEGGLDGNVERPADKQNFTLLLRELRRQLDEQGVTDNRHYELTIAASARLEEIANVEVDLIEPLLDFINVMTYDYHEAPGRTNFNAPLYEARGDVTPTLNVDRTMTAFLDAQVPRGKLLVGIPFYGHAYGSVQDVNHGLFQNGTDKPADWKEHDGDWNVLAKTRLRNSRYVKYWESSARVPFLYDSTSGTWVSYDDPRSVGEKVQYVREHGLGGVVIWELGGDDGSLMRAISGR